MHLKCTYIFYHLNPDHFKFRHECISLTLKHYFPQHFRFRFLPVQLSRGDFHILLNNQVIVLLLYSFMYRLKKLWEIICYRFPSLQNLDLKEINIPQKLSCFIRIKLAHTNLYILNGYKFSVDFFLQRDVLSTYDIASLVLK